MTNFNSLSEEAKCNRERISQLEENSTSVLISPKRKINTIICAAIWYNNGQESANLPKNIKTGIVVSGYRHCNCFGLLAAIYPDYSYNIRGENEPKKLFQGFLTSEGNFVDRVEAASIAFAAGQTSELKRRLFSEDIY